LQRLAVSVFPLHVAPDPQIVVGAGYRHAPPSSQAVAPQVRSARLQPALQQLPIPVVPQTPERQAAFSVQVTPPSSWGMHALAEQ
jgi:hypothetical protein